MRSSSKTPQARRRLWPWIVGGLVLVLIGIPGLWWMSVSSSVNSRLAKAIAAADLDDPNWRLKDIMANRRVVPDDQNSAIVARRVYEQLPDPWPPLPVQQPGRPPVSSTELMDAFEKINQLPVNIRLDDVDAESLKRELANDQEAVGIARTIADSLVGTHDLTIGPTILDTLLTETQRSRSVARLLSADAAVRAHDGDLEGAIASCRAILGVSRSIGDEPFLISGLVRVAIGSVCTHDSRRVLAQGEPSDQALAKLQADLETERAEPILLRGMNGERAGLFEMIRRIGSGEMPISALSDSNNQDLSDPNRPRSYVAPWGKLAFRNQRAIGLEWMNQAVAIAKSPTHEQMALVKEWQAEMKRVKAERFSSFTATLPLLMTPAFDAAINANLRYQGELGSTILLIAAERHRRKTGSWPESLQAIDPSILPVQPLDPLTGKPFLMKRENGKLVIYSVGLNLLDEGGSYEPKRWMSGHDDDVGSVGWDVDQRKLPAQ